MINRRTLLRGGLTLGCSAAAFPWMTSVTLAGAENNRLGENRLVVIILRGAMDGLDAVIPVGDPDFASYRKTLLRPDALPLDSFFAMNPGLAELSPLWAQGQLGFVHATSTPYRDKRSHFIGQDQLEAGTGMDLPADQVKDGWLNRMLRAMPDLHAETAFAVGREDLRILRGNQPVMEWAPDTGMDLSPQARLLFEQVYHDDPLFNAAATEALQLSEMDDLAPVGKGMADPAATKVRGNKSGEVDALAKFTADRLREGTRIAAFSLSGWDTHKAQASSLEKALLRLSRAILQLQKGLGAELWGKTTVLAMTEFGRTVAENGSAGTDHGTGGAMFVAGGAVRGGKVYGQWPGLSEAALYNRRDLMPTTDVRGWAAHALRGLYGMERGFLENTVFPGLLMDDDPGLIL